MLENQSQLPWEGEGGDAHLRMLCVPAHTLNPFKANHMYDIYKFSFDELRYHMTLDK